MPLRDAQALSIAGLNQYYNRSPLLRKALDDVIYEEYNIHLNEVESIEDKYINKTNGTPCN